MDEIIHLTDYIIRLYIFILVIQIFFQLTNYLYNVHPNNVFGKDIVSLDIQRSRNHGIPSYTEFRKYCRLKAIRSVQDLSQIMVEGISLKVF